MKVVLYCEKCESRFKVDGFFENHRKGRTFTILNPDQFCPVCSLTEKKETK